VIDSRRRAVALDQALHFEHDVGHGARSPAWAAAWVCGSLPDPGPAR
jgi:hypothetical protein